MPHAQRIWRLLANVSLHHACSRVRGGTARALASSTREHEAASAAAPRRLPTRPTSLDIRDQSATTSKSEMRLPEAPSGSLLRA
jgi:hypothetical protein